MAGGKWLLLQVDGCWLLVAVASNNQQPQPTLIADAAAAIAAVAVAEVLARLCCGLSRCRQWEG